ncbi:hypothetical protein J6590_078741 [Homalodisca vitripennis]|nr:hypothetical protein J6590_078741 [Homalodisca vitripennis]
MAPTSSKRMPLPLPPNSIEDSAEGYGHISLSLSLCVVTIRLVMLIVGTTQKYSAVDENGYQSSLQRCLSHVNDSLSP